MFLQPHPAIFEQLPFLKSLSIPSPGTTRTIVRSSRPAATAPPAAVVPDAEQVLRDQYFQELLTRCRSGRLLETTITLALDECGRTREQLEDALEAAD